jgi:cold shock CspA family protein
MAAVELGVIVRWDDAKGYGFIGKPGQRPGVGDLFFSASAARQVPGTYVRFRKGDPVAFTRGVDHHGRPCAARVRRVDPLAPRAETGRTA